MKGHALRKLFVEELRDLYDAENRLVKAIPKMAKAVNSSDLRSGLEHHLRQTKGHVNRLKQILESLNEKPTGNKCAAMVGIIQEGDDLMAENFDSNVMDAALISAAQRVEHYEIAAYGCVRAWAETLGEDEAAELLDQTLTEEKETDAKLTTIASTVNTAASAESAEEGEVPSEDEEQDDRGTPVRRRGKSASA